MSRTHTQTHQIIARALPLIKFEIPPVYDSSLFASDLRHPPLAFNNNNPPRAFHFQGHVLMRFYLLSYTDSCSVANLNS